MGAYLGYVYETSFGEKKRIEINAKVFKNRKTLFIFVNLVFAVSQPLAPCAAVMLPPPPRMSRVQYITAETHTNKKCFPTALIIKPKVDILTARQIEALDNFNKGCITKDDYDLIVQMRGGDEWSDLGLILIILYLGWYFNAVDAFPQTPLPHMDPLGWLSGKYTSQPNQHVRSIPQSCFDRTTLHAILEDGDEFIMEYDKAYKLIKEIYSGSVQVTEGFKISDWQALKHMYHGKGLGVDPLHYGISQKELELIRDGGIIAYHKIPSLEHVRAYQEALKAVCQNPDTIRIDDSKHYASNCFLS